MAETTDPRRAAHSSSVLAFAVVWSIDEPQRLGETLFPRPGRPGPVHIFGRGSGDVGAKDRLEFVRQRPGKLEPAGPTQSQRVSREQLRIQAQGRDLVHVENIGRRSLTVNGVEVERAEVRRGDVLEVGRQLSLLCVERPLRLQPLSEDLGVGLHSFGVSDDFGMVGESPVAWELRQRIAFVAGRNTHVLIIGPSGSGKELVAKALHSLSARGKRRMLSRNAATLPEGLIDAELFGNVQGYPNPGMRDRPGLIGEANGSTLLLDEVGELPAELQSHLLRVLDEGEYQRLGEGFMRHSDLRLIAATNRAETALKHDLFARLRVRFLLPELNERLEDIPLIARHVLRSIAAKDSTIADRYFPDGDPATEPRISPDLVRRLVQHHYTLHVRELEALLWEAMTNSPADRIELSPSLRLQARTDASHTEGAELAPAALQAALDKHSGVQSKVWRELGLKNRHVLARLIKKYGLVASPVSEEEDPDPTEEIRPHNDP